MSVFVNQDEEERVEEKAEKIESRRSSTASTSDKSENRRQSVAEKIAKKVSFNVQCSHIRFHLCFSIKIYIHNLSTYIFCNCVQN